MVSTSSVEKTEYAYWMGIYFSGAYLHVDHVSIPAGIFLCNHVNRYAVVIERNQFHRFGKLAENVS